MGTEKNAIQSKLPGMLGLASRAGDLICGTQLCCDGVRSGRARLVLVASDASANTKKRIFNCCTYYETDCTEIPINTFDLGHYIGKTGAVGSVALTDVHFTKGIKKILSNTAFGEKIAEKRNSEV